MRFLAAFRIYRSPVCSMNISFLSMDYARTDEGTEYILYTFEREDFLCLSARQRHGTACVELTLLCCASLLWALVICGRLRCLPPKANRVSLCGRLHIRSYTRWTAMKPHSFCFFWWIKCVMWRLLRLTVPTNWTWWIPPKNFSDSPSM